MILTLGYRGVFRQEQYETVTVEASVTIDTDKDLPDRNLRGVGEVTEAMMDHLDTLIRPLITRAADISRYGSSETVAYEWEGIINEASSKAPSGQPRRSVRRGG